MDYEILLSTAELGALLGKPGLVLCDCRHNLADVNQGRRDYATGHIPGAHFVHLDDDLSAPLTGKNGRHPLPSADGLARKFSALGIDSGKQVVCYDDAGGAIAGRMWWSLRWLGHERVAVLDGGITKWMREGRPLTTEVPRATPNQFVAKPRGDAYVAVDELVRNLSGGSLLVVDARSNERYRGQNETIDPVAGHIPGAVNRFYKENLDAHGCFKPAEQLRAEFTRLLGATPAAQVVNQCGSGVSACHNLLAMERAGLLGAKLYPGSWSEWCADPARPIAT